MAKTKVARIGYVVERNVPVEIDGGYLEEGDGVEVYPTIFLDKDAAEAQAFKWNKEGIEGKLYDKEGWLCDAGIVSVMPDKGESLYDVFKIICPKAAKRFMKESQGSPGMLDDLIAEFIDAEEPPDGNPFEPEPGFDKRLTDEAAKLLLMSWPWLVDTTVTTYPIK